jgi:hypothetical protein
MSETIVIPNKRTAMKLTEDENVSYFHLLKVSTDTLVPGRGIKLPEMRMRLDISKKIENDSSTEVAEFSSEEINMVKTLVSETEWSTMHPDLVEFLEYIEKL